MCVGRQVRALVLKNSGDDPKVAEYLSANGDDKVSERAGSVGCRDGRGWVPGSSCGWGGQGDGGWCASSTCVRARGAYVIGDAQYRCAPPAALRVCDGGCSSVWGSSGLGLASSERGSSGFEWSSSRRLYDTPRVAMFGMWFPVTRSAGGVMLSTASSGMRCVTDLALLMSVWHVSVD